MQGATHNQTDIYQKLEEISRKIDNLETNFDINHQIKYYYTLGTTISSFILPTAVLIVWGIPRHYYMFFDSYIWPLLLSFLAAYSPAYFIPEPKGSPDAGKRKLTRSELIWGFFNSFALFLTVVGTDYFLTPTSTISAAH